ncbi:MmcB family DNA repair protein [Azospirillum doebereinerae]
MFPTRSNTPRATPDAVATPPAPLEEAVAPGGAVPIFRGVRRALAMRGFASLMEFRLACGRRADVLAMDEAGTIVIVEVKSGVPDFRSDQKWPEYRDWCDAFYFAVDDAFPTELIPEDCGLMVADAYGAEVLREAPLRKLAPARRKTLLLRAALAGAGRLHRIEDPMFTQAPPTV